MLQMFVKLQTEFPRRGHQGTIEEAAHKRINIERCGHEFEDDQFKDEKPGE